MFEFNILKVDLEDAPSYKALSYTWKRGLPQRRDLMDVIIEPPDPQYSLARTKLRARLLGSDRHILCDGRVMTVTRNLYNALRDVVRPQGGLWWIDQICINQQDTADRAAQVRRMDKIYTNAEQVVVWLGEPGFLTKGAPSSFAALPDDIDRIYFSELFNFRGMEGVFSLKTWESWVPMAKRWLPVVGVLNHAWFSRVWVLQEAILARDLTFFHGREEIKLERIKTAMKGVNIFADLCNEVYPGSSIPRQTHASFILENRAAFRSGFKWSVEQYVYKVSGRSATNLVDLVYAGLGLVNFDLKTSKGRDIVETIYEKSMEELFQNLTEHLLAGPMGLSALALVRQGGWGLPTWVIDLSTKMQPKPLTDLLVRADTTGEQEAIARIPKYVVDEAELHLKGKIRTRVAKVQSVGSGVTVLLSDIGDVYLPTGEKPLMAIWRLLSADGLNAGCQSYDEVRPGFLRWLFQFLKEAFMDSAYPERTDDATAGPATQDSDAESGEKIGGGALKTGLSLLDRFELWPQDLRVGFESYIRQYLPASDADDLFKIQQDRASSQQSYVYACDTLSRTSGGRCSFCTTDGYIGIGPASLSQGDVIAEIDGMNFAVALQRCERSTDEDLDVVHHIPAATIAQSASDLPAKGNSTKDSRHWLVGEVYIHGLPVGNEIPSGELEEIRLV